MATVFLARDLKHKGPVALKVLFEYLNRAFDVRDILFLRTSPTR